MVLSDFRKSHSRSPIYIQAFIAPGEKWGALIDDNMFVCDAKMLAHFHAYGCDNHSVYGNPMFVNPAAGDYRVKKGSPALKMGFVSFPMDHFGVQKSSLKAIAKTPVLPNLDFNSSSAQNAQIQPVYRWLGIQLHEPVGDYYKLHYGLMSVVPLEVSIYTFC